MGNVSFTPQRMLSNKTPVYVTGFSFSKEHVPRELKSFGDRGHALSTEKMFKSNSNIPDVYVTRTVVNGKVELFLTKDLEPT